MIALALALALVGCSGGLEISHSEVEERIPATLNEQVVEWNNGNIPAFMETYVKSESLRFASGGNTRRGWQETLERYQSAYPSSEAMGRLAFEDLEKKSSLRNGPKCTDDIGCFAKETTRTQPAYSRF